MEFDYIIIGGGVAGSVLASRLSEDSKCTILLLEEGDRVPYGAYRAPASFSLNGGNANHFWQGSGEEEPHLEGRKLSFKRGRVLGGQSMVGSRIYRRGQEEDYKRWYDFTGWSAEDILPFFSKAEKCLEGANDFRSDQGILPVGQALSPSFFERALFRACLEAGHQTNKDMNGDSAHGIGWLDHIAGFGGSYSVADIYLNARVRRRKNLKIMTAARVDKLIFKDHDIRGVKLDGYKAYARCEILLCAGALITPQLLMRCGIGPGKNLSKHKIRVRKELDGVGKNLQDHPEISVTCRLRQPFLPLGIDRHIWRRKMALWLWFISHRGPFAKTYADIGGLITLQGEGEKTQDLYLRASPVLGDKKTDSAFVFSVGMAHPLSRGEVFLKQSTWRHPPGVVFNTLEAEEDKLCLRRGLSEIRNILKAESLRAWVGEEIFSDKNGEKNSDAFIIDHVTMAGHICGTCRIGIDKNAVVDREAKLYGFNGLRIIDASIIPMITSAEPTAPIVMLAEKYASLIRADHH